MNNERSRIVSWEDPTEGAKKGLQLSGLAYMQAIASGEIAPPPVGKLMQMDFEEFGEGWSLFSLTPDESLYNPIGTVHGGPIATVLDSALACCVHTTLPQGTAYTTLEIKINYVRPVTAQSGKLFCKGVVIHRGRRIATSEAHLRDENGKLYAHGTSSCMIFPIT
ncbi:MAG: PaaI family thioesterase [Chloroflexota bacterium]